MRLSKLEYLVMNSRLRRFAQRHIEFKVFNQLLTTHHIDLSGQAILDAGCGSGYSSELITREYSPSRLVSFDFMPEHIRLARKRDLKAVLFLGDMSAMALPPENFDGAFTFGVLHHVPGWRHALREIARVLKPGGVFLVQEFQGKAVAIANSLGFTHPKEARFDWSEFEDGLTAAGLRILDNKKTLFQASAFFLCMRESDK